MKRIFIIIIILALTPAIPGAVALASDISDAEYMSTILTENDGTAITNGIAVFDLDTDDLIAGNMLGADALDCAMLTGTGSDVDFMPGYSANPWCFDVAGIGEDESLYNYLYTKGASGGNIRYFSGETGLTTPDIESLEGTDNLTYKINASVDFTVSDNICGKTETFGIATHGGSGNVTFAFGAPTLQSAYEQNNNNVTVDQNIWIAQTFTCNQTMLLTRVELYWQRAVGLVGDVYYRIRKTSGGAPTGSTDDDIVIGWLDGDTVGGLQWNSVNMTPHTYLLDGNSYAVIMNAPGTAGANVVHWRERQLGIYTEGAEYTSNDSGATWTPTNDDATFRLYGIPVRVASTGATNAEQEITVRAIENQPIYATGNVLDFDNTINSDLDCGAVYNAQADWWLNVTFELPSEFSVASPAHQVLAWKDAGGATYIGLYLNSGDGKLYWQKYTGGVPDFIITSTQTNWTANTPYNVTASISSTQGAKLVVDGGVPVTDPDLSPVPNGGNLYFGQWTASFFYDGIFHKIAVGTDDLTWTEMAGLAEGQVPDDATDIYYIDEGAGATIFSYGTGGNDATMGAGNTWQTASRLCDLTIEVDGNRNGTSLKGVTFPNNDAPIVSCRNSVTPHAGSSNNTIQQIWTQYGLVQTIGWELGATFTDLTGNGNHATPSFRTTATDPDLTAEVTAQSSRVTTSSPSANITGGWTMITELPETPTGLYAEGGDAYPGGDLIVEVAEGAGHGDEVEVYHFGWALSLALLAYLVGFGATHKLKVGRRGSLVVATFAGLGVLIYFYLHETIPGWVMFPYSLINLFLIAWRRSPSPL